MHTLFITVKFVSQSQQMRAKKKKKSRKRGRGAQTVTYFALLHFAIAALVLPHENAGFLLENAHFDNASLDFGLKIMYFGLLKVEPIRHYKLQVCIRQLIALFPQ